MSDSEFNEWAGWYADLFGLRSEADLRMIMTWRGVIDRRGYAAQELKQAAEILLLNDAPTFPSDHAPRLFRRIEAARRQAITAARRQAEAQESLTRVCSLCGNSGCVVVPHPRDVVHDEWMYPFYTAVVSCRCYRGERLLDRHRETPPSAGPMLSLDRYEETVLPNWTEWLKWRAEEQRLEMQSMSGEDPCGIREVLDRIQLQNARRRNSKVSE